VIASTGWIVVYSREWLLIAVELDAGFKGAHPDPAIRHS
jgi:hypothetical protein